MAYYLSSGHATDGDAGGNRLVGGSIPADHMTDLRVFWGPEICRLEYLIHLLDTGRIKDDEGAPAAGNAGSAG
ncbi:MAG: hypothetical protein JOZ41_05210 [Chloroflexi bacterium]|nr:hypothetical protein [Chloroflexota bacterium]